MIPAKAVHCGTCAVRSHSAFGVLESEALDFLDRRKVVQFFPRGQQIFQEGGPALAIHCVHAGHVRLSKRVPRSDDVVVRIAGPGDVLGLPALLASEVHEVTAEAVENTTICTITRSTVDDLSASCPKLLAEMLAVLARDLRASEAKTVEFAQRSVPQRLAHLLLDLLPSDRDRTEPGVPVRLRVRRNEMAHMIGASPETVSRLLHRFERRGIVRLSRTDVELLDTRALHALACDDLA